ncbi:MAG TPA: biopolymer transporter ExbD [Pirellulales bacterium]|nr:biopolymer transporter ExbD [Pirellulales bacterium]
MISFHCNNCGRRLKIDDAFAGRKGSCPRCGVDLVVPVPAPPPPPVPSLSGSASTGLSGSKSGLAGSKSLSRSGLLSQGAATARRRPGPRPPLVRPGSGKLEFREMIDMTAMVDIVFFLLIFFMVTSFNSQQASIEMPTPAPPTGATGKATARRTVEEFENDADFVVVRIDADDTVWVEESVAMTQADLAAKLRQLAGGSGGRSKLLVVGHSEATHGAAVKVMDTAHSVGIDDVRLAVKDEE